MNLEKFQGPADGHDQGGDTRIGNRTQREFEVVEDLVGFSVTEIMRAKNAGAAAKPSASRHKRAQNRFISSEKDTVYFFEKIPKPDYSTHEYLRGGVARGGQGEQHSEHTRRRREEPPKVVEVDLITVRYTASSPPSTSQEIPSTHCDQDYLTGKWWDLPPDCPGFRDLFTLPSNYEEIVKKRETGRGGDGEQDLLGGRVVDGVEEDRGASRLGSRTEGSGWVTRLDCVDSNGYNRLSIEEEEEQKENGYMGIHEQNLKVG
ncbi:hypothetical protein B0H13DRAFT_1883280 [Mycena leptocephala]|nr:hypothetical protein B0H13DRAFT_1883280 [Mycena leptocephala]